MATKQKGLQSYKDSILIYQCQYGQHKEMSKEIKASKIWVWRRTNHEVMREAVTAKLLVTKTKNAAAHPLLDT